ncbi:hypothetical protein ASD8599_00226 [Ascidiaceihabitans donghaensis]|uniref:Uncharacterized protein n=1 Tax=Ascidiaceihabitans donghaensis TaxID=1510460 RepID=A0A2R8B8Z5_9RHOB|nr:hypothetical protein [Ascidiaceihabitans donghaensis]SPH19501.1 hypothetical protein ASD8599_00226 [Ascidiaceihabitans donghaensis]
MMAQSNKNLGTYEASAELPEVAFDYDGYAEVSKAARLFEIKLIDSKYLIKPEISFAIEDLSKMTHGFSGDSDHFTFDAKQGLAMGHYRWTAEIKYGRKKALRLVANYLIGYSDLANFDEANVRHYFDKVGRFATYPYFRALFSHHTSESGLALPPLPTLSERVN